MTTIAQKQHKMITYHKETQIENIIKKKYNVKLIEQGPDYKYYKDGDIIIETDQNGIIKNIKTNLIDELFPTIL